MSLRRMVQFEADRSDDLKPDHFQCNWMERTEAKWTETNLTEYCIKQNKLKVTELNGTWLKDLVNSTEICHLNWVR